ncbi:REF/SRPP-like protein At3g05500 [Quercus suber]|uniref:Ref/srpp-like protein n=1 Tax=Quercus suber TaxID=58331 RepID=A0AAW0LVC8_QUESU|nr:REF/SRPP-like protein At3g05500 [Quercus suber]POE75999.1 ref/srpp-like protein [Quercus suber]
MAEGDLKPQQQEMTEEEQRLKYLQFVQVAAIHTIMCFTNLYVYAKDKSGPLKTGVETVEGTVKSVVGPVYDKFHDVPIEVLKYVDRKVDESVIQLDRRVPPTIKQVSSQAVSAAQKAPVVAQAVASEVKRAGVVDTASGLAKSVYTKYEPTAKELYFKYEPKAEQCAKSAWHKLNQLPLFPQVAQVVVPGAAYCTEKYNQTVRSTAEKGYRVSSYLPLVPTEKIAKVFRADGAESEPKIDKVSRADGAESEPKIAKVFRADGAESEPKIANNVSRADGVESELLISSEKEAAAVSAH